MATQSRSSRSFEVANDSPEVGGGLTDFMFVVNRYYDPVTAQFLSVDPDVGSTGTPFA